MVHTSVRTVTEPVDGKCLVSRCGTYVVRTVTEPVDGK